MSGFGLLDWCSWSLCGWGVLATDAPSPVILKSFSFSVHFPLVWAPLCTFLKCSTAGCAGTGPARCGKWGSPPEKEQTGHLCHLWTENEAECEWMLLASENQRIQTHSLVIILCHLERWIAWMRRSRSKLSVQCLKWKELCPTSSWGNIKCSHTCLALAVANYGALFTCFIKLSSSACSSLLEMGSALC